MNLQSFKDLLQMTDSEWETKLDVVLHENFENEAKEMLIEELVSDVGVDREIIEAVLEYNNINWE